MKKIIFFLNLKKFTSPANEFLLHKYRNKNEKNDIFLLNLKKCTSPADEFPLYKSTNNKKMKK